VKKTIKATLVILLLAVVVAAGIFYFTSQLRGSTETFGIYLLKNNELVISDEEIIWYDKNSYEINLTAEGIERIQMLKVESVTYGEPFVVRIGNQEIYKGSFWTPISSVSYPGIVIETLVNMTDNTIKLEKGYPSSDFFEGVDPRNDQRILDHFQKLGKLKPENSEDSSSYQEITYEGGDSECCFTSSIPIALRHVLQVNLK